MNIRKSFITKFGELIDEHRANRQPSQSGRGDAPSKRATRLLRWLTPNGGTLILIALLVFTQNIWATPALKTANAPGPSATTINYQGRLADSGGNPKNGNFSMSFALYDAASGGNLVWGPETHAAVPVSDGLFSVGLGSQTTGGIPTTVWDGDIYLEVTVGGETLSPRELIRSVPIAGMALTVPDGAIKSNDLKLDSGTYCLSGNTTVEMPGSWQNVEVPGFKLDFNLEQSGKVLIWMDGLARLAQDANGEATIRLKLDGIEQTASFGHDTEDLWFNVKGQRIVSLDSGSHTLQIFTNSQRAGTMTIHGGGAFRTCINYLVLGEQ